MTRHEASPYATVMDDGQLTGRPIVLAGAGPYGGDLEVPEPLVTGGKTWADVDRDICMHAERFPTTRWWIAFSIALAFLGVLVFSLDHALLRRHGHRRREPAGRLGLVHHQLRLLDWHRPRGHAHLGRPLPLPSAVEDRHQPGRRGDDAVRRRLRRDLPDHPPRARLVRLLARAVPERPRPPLGELQLAAGVGHLRDLHLRPRLPRVLVRRAAPRPGHRAGPGDPPLAEGALQRDELRLDRIPPGLAALRVGLHDPRGARDAAGLLGPHDCLVRLRHVGHAGLAHDDLPALLRHRRHLLGVRHGHHADDLHARLLRDEALHHPEPHGGDGEDPACSPG